MKIEIEQVVVGLVAAFVLAISSARAEDAAPVGKVRGLYTELAPNVWMEGSKAGKSAWAEVELDKGWGQSRQRVLVKVAAELGVAKGDLVEVAVAAGGRGVGPMREVSRATQVAAKWFTPQAKAFDAAAQRTASLF